MNKNSISLLASITILIVLLACSTLSPQNSPPTTSPDLKTPANTITAGGMHTCAIKNGAVYCWGYNGSGELGDDTMTNHNTATLVPGLNNAISISAGNSHTCALLDSGKVKCWGNNSSWQLGDSTNNIRLSPVDVNLNDTAIAISARGEHTCALMNNKEVKCWGKNLYGRLGIDSPDRIGKTPETVKNLQDVVMVSAGGEHTCALTGIGAVKCWGHGSEVGDGTDKNAKKPVDVFDMEKNIVSIATGFGSSCALENNGKIKYWGFLSPEYYSITPERLDGFEDNIVSISTGGSHVCAITNEGAIKCLGENEHGQLGNGTTDASYTATDVINLKGKALEISASLINTCALLDNGDIVCWGYNSEGQLGNGTNNNSAEPVTVIGFE